MTRRLRARVRPVVLAAAVATTASAIAATSGVVVPAPAAAAGETTAVAAADYATDTFGDPWDFSNGDDLLLDAGPTGGTAGARIADGLLTFDLPQMGYISPVWGGYPGSLYLGRDGSAPQNRVDAGRYTRLSLHVFASGPVSAGAQWFTCEGLQQSCMGGQPFGLKAGWQTVDIALGASGYPQLPKAWSGSVHGLRLALSPEAGRTHVEIDWMRLYQPSTTVKVGSGSVWDVDSDTRDNTAGNPGWGPVPCSASGCDLSFLPPGGYHVRSGGSDAAVVLRKRARPVVLDPDAVGGLDYAGEYAGSNPWDFAGPDDVVHVGNAHVLGFGDRLSAVNTSNDPYAWLRLPNGFVGDTNRFHRLTIRSGYEGTFDLSDTAGGGSMARVVWQPSNRSGVQQTNDIVTYSGTRTTTVDLLAPGVHEPESGEPAQAWNQAQVTGLRWDPNEDRGARRWTLDRVSLRADDEAGSHFDVRWVDVGYAPGSVATLYRESARDGSGRTKIGEVRQQPGTNVFRWETAGTPEGSYRIRVDVSGAAGSASGVSTGPVQVRRDVAGQSPSPATPLTRDLADACPQGRVTEDGFGDVPAGAVHEAAIDCLAWWRVTSGSGSGYAPDAPVTRGQMATFLAAAVERTGGSLPAARSGSFSDVDGTTHATRINQLAASGVVGGYPDGTFRPGAPVTRAQMATFLAKAYALRTGTELTRAAGYFGDDNGSMHEGSIDRVAGAGVAGGVAEGRYAPGGTVRRAQMASFLVRLLDVLVAGGHGRAPAA